MFINKIMHFFSPISAFVVDEVDHVRSVIVVADKSMGFNVEVKVGEGQKIKSAKIIAPYDMMVSYEDGTSQKVRFLT